MRAHELLFEAQLTSRSLEVLKANLTSYSYGHEAITAWLLKKGIKYITTEYRGPALKQIEPMQLNHTQPAWAHKAAKAGDLYEWLGFLDDDFLHSLTGLVDYLRYLERDHPNLFSRIDRMTFSQAVRASEAWHESLQKKKAAAIGHIEGQERILDVGDHCWWRLTSPEALKAEGFAMGHCVGTYDKRVAENRSQIYSLRDRSNRPHVTVELQHVSGNHFSFQQVKTRGNGGVTMKYVPAVLSLAKKLGGPIWGAAAVRDMTVETGLFYSKDGQFGTFDQLAKEEISVPWGQLRYLDHSEDYSAIHRVYQARSGDAVVELHCRITTENARFSEQSRTIVSKRIYDENDLDSFLLLVNLYKYLIEKDANVWTVHAPMMHRRFSWEDLDPIAEKFGLYRPTREPNWIPAEEVLAQSKEKIETFVKGDRSINGFGEVDFYIKKLVKFKGMPVEKAVQEARKLLPKVTSKLGKEFQEARPSNVFLMRYGSEEYWFYNTAEQRISEYTQKELRADIIRLKRLQAAQAQSRL